MPVTEAVLTRRPPTREIFDSLPQLPLRERDRRWNAIRAGMSSQGIDALLVIGNDLSFGLGVANIRYLSQIGCRHGGFVIFPLSGNPVAFIGPSHMAEPYHPYLLSQDWVDDIRPNLGIDVAIKQLRESVSPLKTVGIVSGANQMQPDNIPHLLWATIVECFKDVELVDASAIIYSLRSIKSEDEIDLLRRAGKQQEKMVQAMIDSAASGIRDSEVYAAMVAAMIRNGGEGDIFNFFNSGSINAPEQQHLLHGIDPNISPCGRVLRKGDIIVSETHSKYGGYMTHAEMTVCIGEPPAAYRRLFDVAVECLHIAMEKFKPGTPIKEVLLAERALMKKHGYGWLELGFHGHGLGSPEYPSPTYIMNDEKIQSPLSGGDEILREGMVLANNIDIHDPAFRDDVGITYGNTLVVRPQPELLVQIPETLPVKE